MTRREAVLNDLKREMEIQLEEFYRVPIDNFIRPRLDAFLKQWEENFSPYVQLKFTYRIEGQRLDITATMPELSKYMIDIRKRYRPLVAHDHPKWER